MKLSRKYTGFLVAIIPGILSLFVGAGPMEAVYLSGLTVATFVLIESIKFQWPLSEPGLSAILLWSGLAIGFFSSSTQAFPHFFARSPAELQTAASFLFAGASLEVLLMYPNPDKGRRFLRSSIQVAVAVLAITGGLYLFGVLHLFYHPRSFASHSLIALTMILLIAIAFFFTFHRDVEDVRSRQLEYHRALFVVVFILDFISIYFFPIHNIFQNTDSLASAIPAVLPLLAVFIFFRMVDQAQPNTNLKDINQYSSPEAIAIQTSSSSIMITDIDGNIQFVNPQAVETTGYEEQELIGENPRVLKSEFMPEHLYKELWDTILSGQTWKGELINRKKNGDLFREFATISPMRGKSDKLTGFVAVKENLYYRNRAEAAEAEISAYSRKIETLEKELKYFEDLYGSSSTSSVTSAAYGQGTLNQMKGEYYNEFVEKYKELLKMYMDSQTYKVDYDREELIQRYVNSLGFVKARPKDIIGIHSKAIKEYIQGMSRQQQSALMTESRLLILEVMGYLASYYRKYFVIHIKNESDEKS